jgi:hypothetical protein
MGGAEQITTTAVMDAEVTEDEPHRCRTQLLQPHRVHKWLPWPINAKRKLAIDSSVLVRVVAIDVWLPPKTSLSPIEFRRVSYQLGKFITQYILNS